MIPLLSITRPTIGFFNASGLDFYQQAWCGIADVAREHNVNAINFVGNYVRDTIGFKAQANILYNLIDFNHVSGLVIQDLMCNLLNDEEASFFYEQYRALPIVSIGRRPLDGIPCIQSDGYIGMRKAIIHLIEVHNCRRIAFIKGLPNYRPHDERYKAYIDVLSEYGLPFDPSFVAVPRDAAECENVNWGQIAINQLLDEKKANIDALVANDDRYAYTAIPELQNRGIRVPGEISLVSFDDEEGSYCFTPPLTTIPIPIYEVGRKAAETLLKMIHGEEVSGKIVDVPSDRIIVRQSCGCLDPKVLKVVADRGEIANNKYNNLMDRNSILEVVLESVEETKDSPILGLIEQLLDSFLKTLRTEKLFNWPVSFLSTFDEILYQVMITDGNIETWQKILFALRQNIQPYLRNENHFVLSQVQIEDLWLQAQIMVSEVMQRSQALRELKTRQRRRILSDIGTALATNFEVKDLREILSRELPQLGISRGFISLYENPYPYQYPERSPEWSRLVVGFDEEDPESDQKYNFNPEGQRFLSRLLVPSEYLNKTRQYNLIVVSLYFQNEQIGFAVFEEGPRDGMVYELLQSQISSVLKGALLLQQAQQARKLAEKADQVKTRLLANVSHELRTPLNIILGYSQDTIETPYPQNSTAYQSIMKNLFHIKNNAEHQLRVINDLLDLSRAEIEELDLYLELIDPRPLFQDAFESIKHSNPTENVNWLLQVPERLPSIQADPVRLRQILLNLLSNAQRFTIKGSIVFGAEVEPPNLHVWVKDTGDGISLDLQERIFEPFVTAEHTGRRPEGIGLGLSITRRLIALHDGSMKLESELGLGSTFHIYLPLPNLSDKSIKSTKSTQSILLLISNSDHPSEEIVGLCQRQKYCIKQISESENLDDLLSSINPAIVAWDLSEANKNHWRIIRRLHNHPQMLQIPFILYGQEDAPDASFGLTGVVLKPHNPKNLLGVINALDPQKMTGPILVVDDDKKTRETLQELITKNFPDHLVSTVNNGKEALDFVTKQIPCLILLDLMMPEMTGFDVLDSIRTDSRTYKTPVIILTSKILNIDDIKRIEQYSQVIVQSKGILEDQEIIASLHQSLFGSDALPLSTSSLVKKTIAFMHQNYTRPIARWEIAKTIGVSENYSTYLFSKELGISPWDYLNRFRINQAKELLQRTQISVKIIAKQVGFNDQKYFSRVFKKITGVAPNDFRG